MKNSEHKKVGTWKQGSNLAILTFHDYFGAIQDRIKGKVTEKDKGVLMVEKIQDRFGITLDFCRQRLLELNIEAMKPTEYPKGTEPIKWTRDEKGQIESPFKSKKIV